MIPRVYKPGSKFEKDPSFYRDPGTEYSLFQITNRQHAKLRKDMLQPFFSRGAIQRLESSIQDKITIFLDKLKIASDEDKAVDLTLGFPCLTGDIVMYYCYQRTFGALEAPDFQFEANKHIQDFFALLQAARYFPNFFNYLDRVISRLPLAVLKKNAPAVAATLWIRNVSITHRHCRSHPDIKQSNHSHQQCRERILELMGRPKIPQPEHQSTSTPTVFDTMLNPDTSKGQYTPSERGLTDDAFLMFVAGTDTTANTLCYGTWHVLRDPKIQARLKEELKKAMPDRNATPSWAALESIPYLRGVVKEALRFGYGVPGRVPRIVPDSGAVLCGQRIPGRTSVASSAYIYHTDERLFANAGDFRPERWSEEAHSSELERRLLSFSGGPRGCLGMNLAYAELYITFARLFRRFDLSICETIDKDMIWDDCFVPKSRGHFRIKVHESCD